ncbi:MAG: hypothetical protein GXY44_13390 [Phycisphaerales bacterium]|nr:hypothetical protein [Phycisphaerales bacterium]
MGALPEDELVATCADCGASIYREHIHRRLAGRWAGGLYCGHCLAARQGVNVSEDLASLSLADETEVGDRNQRSSVMGGSSVLSDSTAGDLVAYKRTLNITGQAATRVRTFHARLTEGAMRNLDRQVNAWVDSNPEIEIKFSTTTIAPWEGKQAEPHLILMIFY